MISVIVAASQNGVIGQKGALPWKLPGEMSYFKKVTMGHPIIMGRKTHESIGRALPGRQNIVITHDKNYQAPGCDVVGSIDEALTAVQGSDEAFVIGGANIYQQVMDKIDKVYLTRVKASIEGDAYFNFNQNNWKQIFSEKHSADQSNPYTFELQQWVRKK